MAEMRLVGGPRDGALIHLPAERDRVFTVPVPTPPVQMIDGVVPDGGLSTAQYRVGMGDHGEPIGVYVEGSHNPQWW